MPWALSSMALVGGGVERRDAAVGAYRPSIAARDEAHGVVGDATEQFPCLSAVGGDVGSRRAGNHPELAAGQPGDGGTEPHRAGAGRTRPGGATVRSEGDILPVLLVLRVIAAYCDSVTRIGERERENAGRGAIVAHRAGGDGPRAAAIRGVEDAGSPRAAGAEPGLARDQQR